MKLKPLFFRTFLFYLIVFLSIFLLPATEKAYATHAAGADLTYRWISGNTYEVTGTFYRDCAGIAAPTTLTINYSSSSCNRSGSVSISKISNTGLEITFPCSTAATKCNGGSSPGYQQYVYRGNVTFPVKCADWVISYAVSARNCAITTMQQPANCASNSTTEIFVEATLNNLNFTSNNSPTFANYPIAFVCQGQTFAYNHGVTDVDGDSLYYELINALQAHNTSIPYINPYSGTNPIASAPAVSINAGTGNVIMNPTTLQIGVIAVRVKEYRGGVLIGSVIRDMQIIVINCAANLLPTATGMNNTNKFSATVCPGSTISFNVLSNDLNAGQIVTMTWDSSIVGATFTSAGSPHPMGTFSWAPTLANARTQPYQFTITVRDNNCPTNGLQTYSYSIFVPNISATLSATNIACNGGNSGSINVTPAGGTSPYKYSWSPSGGTFATATGLTAQTYTVVVTDSNNCSKSFSQVLTQPTALNVTLDSSKNVLCNGGNIGVASVTGSGGTGPYNYLWSNGATTKIISSLASGTYSCTVTDVKGCAKVISVVITQPSAITGVFDSVKNITCRGNKNGSIDLSVSGGTAGYTYLWTPGGFTTEDVSGLDTGTYVVIITDANGCTTVKSTPVTQPASVVPPIDTIGLGTVSNLLCHLDFTGSVSLNTSTLGGTPPLSYSWSNGATTPSVTGLGAGPITLLITDANGCTADTTFNIAQPDPVSIPSPFISAFPGDYNVTCHGSSDGFISLNPSGGTPSYNYVWNSGAYTTQNISNIPAGTYSVVVTDSHGCTAAHSYVLIQPDTLISSVTGVNIACKGGHNGKVFTHTAGGVPTYSYNWLPGTLPNDSGATGLYAGFYSVTITDLNGCTAIDTMTLTEPDTIKPIIVAATIHGVNIRCFNDSSGVAYIDTVLGGTQPFSFSWSNGTFGDSLIGVPTGEYAVEIKDSNGCILDTTVTLTQPAPIKDTLVASNYGGFQISCNGLCNGFAMADTVFGGIAPYTYSWLNPISNADSIGGLCSGIYQFLITDFNRCEHLDSVTLNAPTPIAISYNASAFGGYNIDCNGSLSGSLGLSVTGGVGNYKYLWSLGGETTASISNISAGTYCVQITDGNNCPFDTCFVLTQPDTISTSIFPSVYSGGTNISCFGILDGHASIIPSGGVAPYVVIWNTGDTATSIDYVAAGTYTYTVTDANGCQKPGSVVLTEPAQMNIIRDAAPSILCHGDTTGCIYITVTGGVTPYSYDWPNEKPIEDQCNLAAGTYAVIITDQNGCVRDSAFALGEPAALSNLPVLSLYAGGFNIQCNGQSNGSIVLNQSGGVPPYNYSWSNSATTDSIGGLLAGTYSVHITDANGCFADTSFVLTEPPAIVLDSISSSPATCALNNGTATVIVSGGVFPYSYSWSPAGGSGSTATGLSSGSYTVIVTDDVGCIISPSTSVGNTANLTASLQSHVNVSCTGDNNGTATVTPAGGTQPYTFNWSPSGGTDATATGLAPNTYTCIVTDAASCSYAVSGIVIDEPAALNASLALTVVSCVGTSSGTATVNVIGGTPNYSFSWSPSGGTNITAINLAPGTYTCTVTDSSGCSSAVTGIIINQSTLATSASSTDAGCGVNNGTATVAPSGGQIPYSYNWSPAVSTTATASGLAAGTYSIIIGDGTGCSTTAVAVVSQIAVLNTSTAIVNPLCNGDGNGSLTFTTSGGTLPYTYNWSPAVSTDSSATGLSANKYTVTITDGKGCTTTATGVVADPAKLTATVSSTNVICNSQNNGTAAITALGGASPYTYSWSSSAGTDASATGLSPGTYTIIITDDNGCTNSASAVITEPLPLVTSAGRDTTICGTSFQLNGLLGNGQLGTWIGNGSIANLNNPTTVVSGLAFGPDTLQWSIIELATGCRASATVVINAFQPVTASVKQADTSICVKDFSMSLGQFKLEALNPSPGAGKWTVTGAGTLSDSLILAPVYVASADTGTHIIEWTVTNGPCRDVAVVNLHVINEGACLDLELPNGFSPNGDGPNDTYVIVGIEGYPVNKFKVFNRWGNEVFSRDNYANHNSARDWAGQNNSSEPLPDGTYYVILVADGGNVVRNTYVDLRR